MAPSASLEEPADLTIRLGSGKSISIRTRPILVVSRLWTTDTENDLVLQIAAPPTGGQGPLAQKVREAEEILTSWGAVPNERMRATLKELKGYADQPAGIGGPGIVTLQRVGSASIDDGTEVLFEFWGKADSWNIVAIVSAKRTKWQPLWLAAERRKTAGTRPAVPR